MRRAAQVFALAGPQPEVLTTCVARAFATAIVVEIERMADPDANRAGLVQIAIRNAAAPDTAHVAAIAGADLELAARDLPALVAALAAAVATAERMGLLAPAVGGR